MDCAVSRAAPQAPRSGVVVRTGRTRACPGVIPVSVTLTLFNRLCNACGLKWAKEVRNAAKQTIPAPRSPPPMVLGPRKRTYTSMVHPKSPPQGLFASKDGLPTSDAAPLSKEGSIEENLYLAGTLPEPASPVLFTGDLAVRARKLRVM